MSELADYGQDLIDINRVIRRLAPICGVDLSNLNNINALLDNAHLPLHTVQDKSRVTLRGLMFLRLKVWQEIRA